MQRETTIELEKEAMKFSAGHFTVFSATERERLHGHNFSVAAALTSRIGADGLAIDYGIYKRQLLALCQKYNEYFLLPDRSPHLRIERRGEHVIAHFNGDEIPFLSKDVLVLPIPNVTIEQLSGLLLEELVAFRNAEGHDMVRAFVVRVFTGPGQSASATWHADP
jgi:6-pyruvoyltetrahydropterin/6-carboxytetrahydropterin synthase